MHQVPCTLLLTLAAIAVATGCSEPNDEIASLAKEFREQARAFVELDDPDALDRLWVLGTQLSHPPLPAYGVTLVAYHRSFPEEYGSIFSGLRQDFARVIREHDYDGFVWYRYDTGPATSDDEPVLLSAWGDTDFILDVRGILEDQATKSIENQDG